MNEPLREMVSAVVDGEAGEFELRRVLDGLDDADAKVKALLTRHYAVRAVVRREAACLCPQRTSDAIFAALDAEPPRAAARLAGRWRVPIGGVAVAASVCMVAVLGLRGFAPTGGEAASDELQLAATGTEALPQLGPPLRIVNALPSVAVPVGFGAPAHLSSATIQTSAANRLAEDHLRFYMGEHVQNAWLNASQGMLPYARFVSDDLQ